MGTPQMSTNVIALPSSVFSINYKSMTNIKEDGKELREKIIEILYQGCLVKGKTYGWAADEIMTLLQQSIDTAVRKEDYGRKPTKTKNTKYS
jgi:hypothetical protein